MASIRWLLDTFGPPPRDVCLDWLWQINAAASSPSVAATAAEARSATAESVNDRDDWTSLEVASDGLLGLERLSLAMARQATIALHESLSTCPTGNGHITSELRGTSNADIGPAAETIGASERLNQSFADCGHSPRSANRKHKPASIPFSWKDRRRHLTLAGVLLAALGTVWVCLGIPQDASAPADAKESASATATSKFMPDAAPNGDIRLQQEARGDEDWITQDSRALAADWTTSDELTEAASAEPAALPELATASGRDLTMRLSPAPSLSTKSSESAAPLPLAASDGVKAKVSAAAVSQPVSDAATEQPLASPAIADVLSQVAAAAQQAELHSGEDVTDAVSDQTGRAADAAAGSPPDGDWTRQPALMLARDARVLRPAFPRELSRRVREPHWTARIEVADGFHCEPAGVQTLPPRAGAQWRIYETDAPSPRACLIVSVRRRGGRDAGLEWSLRGGAEDLPALHLPVDRQWLDAVTSQLKVTSASLQALVDAPTQKTPREFRALIQNQRQLARRQLTLAERLIGALAEIDRMASLLDDELLCHAELRESDEGTLLLAYGSCQSAPAEAVDSEEAEAQGDKEDEEAK